MKKTFFELQVYKVIESVHQKYITLKRYACTLCNFTATLRNSEMNVRHLNTFYNVKL